jgi:hypothetical protein
MTENTVEPKEIIGDRRKNFRASDKLDQKR